VSIRTFFARELAPSHRRIVEAARNAVKSTVTTGLAATMQIVGPFGPLFAFRIGQPGISLGIFEGSLAIAFAAAMQAAIVPITGQLLDYPGLIIAFLFVVFATIAYFLSNTRLFLILALVAIGTITTVYVGIFEPGAIGWGSTYTFDGILLATMVLVVIDTLIWPSLPEPRLLESIAAGLERSRARLELVGRHYLDPLDVSLPAQQVTSVLARNLVLLKAVEEQMKPAPQHLAALVDAVMTAEHVYLEVERLVVVVDEQVTGTIRQGHRKEIEGALRDLDQSFEEKIKDLRGDREDSQDSSESIADLQLTIQSLGELSAHLTSIAHESAAPELSNVLRFLRGLEAIGNLLDVRERPQGSAAAEPRAETDNERRALFDPAAFRFSVKLGAAITLGLLVGLTTQRADLQTILWSIAVAGQPNQYGAVVRKTLLRLSGCVFGGLAALAAMILVSQNFDSLPAYAAAIFVVTFFSTYVAQSSEWLGYTGIQAGITFLICYVGLGPSSDVYKPLWRFWGIILGVLTTGFVFLFLWPEYARDKLTAQLDKLIRTTLSFGRAVAERRVTADSIGALERRLSADLLGVLNMADQARLEGRRGTTNSAAAVEAASTIVRIAYRFELIALPRLTGSAVAEPEGMLEQQVAFEQACCAALEAQLARLENNESPEHPSSAALIPDSGGITADSDAVETTHPLVEDRIGRMTDLESYRRLPILLRSLDNSLSRISASSANR
jgi:hypothetical protein